MERKGSNKNPPHHQAFKVPKMKLVRQSSLGLATLHKLLSPDHRLTSKLSYCLNVCMIKMLSDRERKNQAVVLANASLVL